MVIIIFRIRNLHVYLFSLSDPNLYEAEVQKARFPHQLFTMFGPDGRIREKGKWSCCHLRDTNNRPLSMKKGIKVVDRQGKRSIESQRDLEALDIPRGLDTKRCTSLVVDRERAT